jgi:hypothetical protein
MERLMGGPEIAVFITGGVHVLGAVFLIWLVLRSDENADLLGWWRDDEDPPDESGPRGPVAPAGGGLPLPDAEPSPMRLRGPGRITDRRPRPARRPEHEPQPAPVREPSVPGAAARGHAPSR